MRTSLLLVTVSAIWFASCSSGNKMQSSVQGDDLYISKTESTVSTPSENYNTDSYTGGNQEGEVTPDYSSTEKYTDENGTNYITNNYYEGQNYDFYGNQNSYSSQLSHWYGPSLGFSYFSPYYMGGFGPSISFGFGWSSGWYNPFYSPFYSPYYSYNPWYSPYYYGYNPYYNPYCGGGYYGGGYYGGDGNGYGYGNNTYYGPHGSSSGNSSNNGDGRKYKYDDATNQSTINNSYNSSGLSVTPTSINVANSSDDLAAPVKSTGSIGISDAKGNMNIQNNNQSGSGLIKTGTDRNVISPLNGNEIKSTVPANHSMSPSNVPVRQNKQDNRPRTDAGSSLFEQQHAANASLNSGNNSQVDMNQFNQQMKLEGAVKTAQTANNADLKKVEISSSQQSQANPKISIPQTRTGKNSTYEKPAKHNSQHNNLDVDRSNSGNAGNSGRNYNTSQHSNSGSSSGSNRSTGNSTTPRRK